MIKNKKRLISFALILTLLLAMVPAMLASATVPIPRPMRLCVGHVCAMEHFLCASCESNCQATHTGKSITRYDEVNVANPALFIEFVAYDDQVIMTEHATFRWDEIRRYGDHITREFCGDVAVIEVDSIADIYDDTFNIFGGYKVFTDWDKVARGIGFAGPDDVFWVTPTKLGLDGEPVMPWMDGADFTSTMTIVAPSSNWMGEDGGYIGIRGYRYSSELVLWAIDPFDGNTRNPLVQQPYFKKLPNEVTKEYDPIYVKFRTTYLGNVYEAWFKIIERKPGRAMTENGTLRPVNIIAYLNGFFIPSLNVDGRTVVSEELLPYYGYDLTWCPVRNRLSITYNPCKFVIPDPELVNREVLRWQTFSKGDITRSVGATNVRVEIGTYWWRTGKEVTADRTTADDIRIYRIDGTMYVNIEDLGASSYDNLRREIIVNGQYGTMNVYDNDGKWVRTRIGESNIKVTRKRP